MNNWTDEQLNTWLDSLDSLDIKWWRSGSKASLTGHRSEAMARITAVQRHLHDLSNPLSLIVRVLGLEKPLDQKSSRMMKWCFRVALEGQPWKRTQWGPRRFWPFTPCAKPKGEQLGFTANPGKDPNVFQFTTNMATMLDQWFLLNMEKHKGKG